MKLKIFHATSVINSPSNNLKIFKKNFKTSIIRTHMHVLHIINRFSLTDQYDSHLLNLSFHDLVKVNNETNTL